jgi:hypothetical protein
MQQVCRGQFDTHFVALVYRQTAADERIDTFRSLIAAKQSRAAALTFSATRTTDSRIDLNQRML